MSDGPHRSLPMRAKWKKVAELAGNRTHDLDDLSAAICEAIGADWRREVSSGVLNAVVDTLRQPSLIPEVTISKLEKIKQFAAGKALVIFLVDSLIQEARAGVLDSESIQRAVTATIIDRTGRCQRQMEELCLRKASVSKTRSLIQRFAEGAKEIGFETLARNMMNGNKNPIYKRVMHVGLDDGPEI